MPLRLPHPRGDAPHGPVSDDTPRMRLSLGLATTAPPGGGGGGQRPGGVGVYCNQRQERGACPPRLPLPPWRCPHGPGYGGELEEKAGRGGGCRHIATRDRGEAHAPSPSAPPPWRCPHGPGYGGELEEKAGRGFALPDAVFPGYRHDCPRPPGGRGRRPEAGRGGGILQPETGGAGSPYGR
jgi:hypothetical protein